MIYTKLCQKIKNSQTRILVYFSLKYKNRMEWISIYSIKYMNATKLTNKPNDLKIR